ncbi:MAG: hypothetical protein NUV82_00605 [Candidatus Komeilibacteria bacterium]|nr:hypothetical protein [Candidatus Komeilibacteria bacterium]
MFLTVHSAVGMAIASRIDDPVAVFVLAVASHYILDSIPHGDDNLVDKSLPELIRRRKLTRIFMVEVVLVLVLGFFILTKVPINPVYMWLAVLGAMLPDILWGVHSVVKWRWLEPHNRFHNLVHNPLKIIISLRKGLILQAIALVLIISFIL